MSTIELTTKIRELKELQLLIEEAESEAEAIKDIIKAHMTAENTDTLTVDIFKVRWTTVTSNRFDSAEFKKKYVDLYNAYTRQSITRRFSVA